MQALTNQERQKSINSQVKSIRVPHLCHMHYSHVRILIQTHRLEYIKSTLAPYGIMFWPESLCKVIAPVITHLQNSIWFDIPRGYREKYGEN